MKKSKRGLKGVCFPFSDIKCPLMEVICPLLNISLFYIYADN